MPTLGPARAWCAGMWLQRSILPIALGGVALGVASDARAGAICIVPLESNPVQAGVLLGDCVDEVNMGEADTIQFEGVQKHALTQPLVLERDVTIDGPGQVINADPGFSGDALFVVGSGSGVVNATLQGLSLQWGDVPGIRAARVLSQQRLTLDTVDVFGFRVTGDGACVYAEQEAQLSIVDGSFIWCTATGGGGAVFSEGSLTAVDGTLFESNEADFGGGIYIGGSGMFSRTLVVNNAVFRYGNALTHGGAVHAHVGTLTTQLNDTSFDANVAEDNGGAVYGRADIARCEFTNNRVFDLGGAAFLRDPSTVRDTTFAGNVAQRGGGLAVFGTGAADVFVEHTTFVGNFVTEPHVGGGMPPVVWGGGMFVGRSTPPHAGTTIVRNSTFHANASDTALRDYGGGFGSQGVAATLEHVTFDANVSTNGGGMYINPRSSTILNLRSSIVAGSTGADCVFTSPTNSATFNVTTSLGQDGSCGSADAGDPMLGPLTNNGGPTETQIPGDPQLVDEAMCYSNVDQRYVARPATDCEMGAVELP